MRLRGLEPGHTAENADKMGGFNIVHAFVTGVVTGKQRWRPCWPPSILELIPDPQNPGYMMIKKVLNKPKTFA